MKNDLSKPRISLARNTARGIIAELNEIAVPVKISTIVSHLKNKRGINIEIYKRDLGKNTRGIQITAKSSTGEILFIGYDEKQHDHSKRFTVAHELGHFLLGHTRDGHDHYLELFDEGSGNLKEIEANQFAAELLIPSSLLKIDIDNGTNDVPTLSCKYWVSELAMWKKVLDFNLVKNLKT